MIDAIKKTISLHEKALEEGIAYYELKNRMFVACPLCTFSNKEDSLLGEDYYDEDGKVESSCRHCPWMLFEGHTCESSEERVRDESLTPILKIPEYAYHDSKKSIKRLKGWLDKLEKEV